MVRLIGQATAVLLITVTLGEVVARWIFDLQPLTTENLVWQYHPRWGWSHVPGAEDTFVKLSFRQTIQINSRGLREREIPYEKPPGLFRVLVIGDSHVVGFEVAARNVFTRVAETELKKRGYSVQFINGGHRGYGTDQALLFLNEEGLNYHPDLVLYRWSTNDLIDNLTVHQPYRRFGKPYFNTGPDGSLILRGVPVPHYDYTEYLVVGRDGSVQRLNVSQYLAARMWVRDHLVTRSALATAAAHVVEGYLQLARRILSPSAPGDSSDDVVPEWQKTPPWFRLASALIREMWRASKAAGAKFRMIAVDSPEARLLQELIALPDLDDHLLFEDRIPIGVKITAPLDTHFNELGHRLFGEALAEALLEARLLPTTHAQRAD